MRGLIGAEGVADQGGVLDQLNQQIAALPRIAQGWTEAAERMREARRELEQMGEKARAALADFLAIGDTQFDVALRLSPTALTDLRFDLESAVKDALQRLEAAQRARAFAPTLRALRLPVEIDDAPIREAEDALGNLSADLISTDSTWRNFNANAEEAAENLRDARSDAQRLADTIAEVAGGLSDVAGAAAGIGLIGDEAARSIGNVLSLADAVGRVAEKASTGNILGVVSAGIDLLGGLFGPSETAQEHEAILRENTRALQTAADAMRGPTGIGALAQAQADLLRIVQESGSLLSTVTNLANFFGDSGTEILDRELREVGSSPEELNRIARENDITLLDSKGRLVRRRYSNWRTRSDSWLRQPLDLATPSPSSSNVWIWGPGSGVMPVDQLRHSSGRSTPSSPPSARAARS